MLNCGSFCKCMCVVSRYNSIYMQIPAFFFVHLQMASETKTNQVCLYQQCTQTVHNKQNFLNINQNVFTEAKQQNLFRMNTGDERMKEQKPCQKVFRCCFFFIRTEILLKCKIKCAHINVKFNKGTMQTLFIWFCFDQCWIKYLALLSMFL